MFRLLLNIVSIIIKIPQLILDLPEARLAASVFQISRQSPFNFRYLLLIYPSIYRYLLTFYFFNMPEHPFNRRFPSLLHFLSHLTVTSTAWFRIALTS